VNSESEALQLFNNFSYKLMALLTGCPTKMLSRDSLQQFCDLLRSNPGWTAAHVAAKMLLTECFRSEFVATLVSLLLSHNLNTLPFFCYDFLICSNIFDSGEIFWSFM